MIFLVSSILLLSLLAGHHTKIKISENKNSFRKNQYEIEKEYEGRAVIGTADVDECSDLAAQFRIRNVPTVLFFKGGSDQPVDKSVGLVAKETLTEKLNALL